MVRAHGTVVLIRHIHLVVFFLVALHARVVWAAPLQAQGGDEGGSNDYPVSRLDVGLEPLGHPGDPLKVNSFSTSSPIPVLQPESNLTPTGVPVEKAFPAPRLHPALVPVWRCRGTTGVKFQADGGKKSFSEEKASEVLGEILKELERGQEADQETMKKEVFPEGSNDSLPVCDEEREVMRATGMLGSCCPVVSWCHLSYQDRCVSADFPPSARSCASRQQPKLKVFWVQGIWTTFHR